MILSRLKNSRCLIRTVQSKNEDRKTQADKNGEKLIIDFPPFLFPLLYVAPYSGKSGQAARHEHNSGSGRKPGVEIVQLDTKARSCDSEFL